MASMQRNLDSIEKYLNADKQEEILNKIRTALQIDKSTPLEINQVTFLDKKDMCRDSEGYISNSVITLGRYCPNEKIILLNKDDLHKKVTELQNALYRKRNFQMNACLLCDFIFIHECMHAYQHQIKNKIMKKNDKELEEEANNLVLLVFEKTYDGINDSEIQEITNILQN